MAISIDTDVCESTGVEHDTPGVAGAKTVTEGEQRVFVGNPSRRIVPAFCQFGALPNVCPREFVAQARGALELITKRMNPGVQIIDPATEGFAMGRVNRKQALPRQLVLNHLEVVVSWCS